MVELAGRLVGQQQARPVGQCDREGEALLLAAGEQARGPPGGRAQPHRVEQARGAAPLDRPGAAGRALREQHVAQGGLVVQQVAARVLEHHADIAQPHVRGRPAGQVADAPPAHLDHAGRGPQQAGQQPQQRGLPGPGRAEQRDRVSLGHGEIHPAQRGDLLAGVAVHLDQAFAAHHDRRRGRHALPGPGPGRPRHPRSFPRAAHVGVSRNWSRLTLRTSSRPAVPAAAASSTTATPSSTTSGAAAGT